MDMNCEKNILKDETFTEKPISAEDKLLEHINSDQFGNGKISSVAYNSAWVARLTNESNKPMFASSLDYVRQNQYSDGSLGASYPVSLFDRIITTLIVLITLKQWNMDEDQHRIVSATNYLQENLQKLAKFSNIQDQMTAAFEVLLPALVEQAQKFGIILDIEEVIQPYLEERDKKFNKIKASQSSKQITPIKSWHLSLEAFGEVYPVDKMQKLVQNNGLIASSYSSTAYALYRGLKSEDSLKQLEKIVNENRGGVPPLYQVAIFDLAWSFNSLIFSGFPIQHNSLKLHLDKLELIFKNSKGILGAAIGNPEDSDDTANCILALKKSGRLTEEEKALSKLFQFLRQDYFITYEGERDPSLSSNVNCLITLKEFLNYEKVALIVKQVCKWTKALIINRGYNFNDKWHMSKYYGMGRALIAFVNLDIDLSKQILNMLFNEQRSDGGWGAFQKSTRLETSYAVLGIIYALKVCPTLIKADVFGILKMAKKFMDKCNDDEQDYKFWIEKCLYCPINVDKMSILSACYALEKFQF